MRAIATVLLAALLDKLAQDIRYAWRACRRAPAFTITTILTLALGIGGTTAIFTMIDAVLLRPLPYAEADRILALGSPPPQLYNAQSGALFHYLRGRLPAFERMAALRGSTGWNLVVDGRAEYVQGLRVSAGYFDVLGATPIAGRTFTEAEDQTGGSNAVVIGESTWRRSFESRADAIGAVVRLGGTPHTVVGVMPASFQSIPRADVWTPLRLSPRDSTLNYQILARLRPDATPALAAAQLEAVRPSLAADLADFDGNIARRVGFVAWLPYKMVVSAADRTPLLLLLGAVGLVLLLSCANLAALHLVRATARRREMATRAALGGGRARIAAQVLTESLTLALAGAAGGVLAAYVSLGLLLPLVSTNLLAGQTVQIDGRAIGVAAFLSILAGVAFGIWPAVEVARTDVRTALGESGSRATGGRRTLWTRRAFVFVQIAAACVLLLGSGLLVRALIRMIGVDPGFQPSGVFTAQMSLQGAPQSPAELSAFYERTLERIRALPGIEAAAVGSNVPVERGLNLAIEPAGSIDQIRAMDWRYITPEYFAAFQIPIRAGRAFDSRDTATGAPVAIVNEAFARAYFGGTPAALGQPVQLVNAIAQDTPRVVVGVVGDVRSESGAGWTSGPALIAAAPPTVYFPAVQVPERLLPLVHGFRPITWIVRTRGSQWALMPALEQVVRDEAPTQPLIAFATMDELMAESMERQRVMLRVLGAFAAVALILASIGLYGLIAYGVAERRREIGVRLALGATSARVLRMFAREGVGLAAAGIAVGLGGALGISRLVTLGVTFRGLGIEPLDPIAFASVAGVLGAVAVVASVIPARRAARVSPAEALRCD